MSKIRISYLPRGERDNEPRGRDLEWDQLCHVLGANGIDEAACTLETCAKGENLLLHWKTGKPIGCKHKYTKAWSPAVYPPGATRANKNVGVVSLLVVDLDHLTDAELERASDVLEPYRYVAHPSHSDRPGDRCWRVVVALSEPVLAADWPRFWVTAMTQLGQPADPACCDAARLYFLPTRRADTDGQTTRAIANAGKPLDVKEILAAAPPATPERSLPGLGGDFEPATPAQLAAAEEHVMRRGPAIEGQNGDRHTYSVCATLMHGWGLTTEEAWPILERWNATCVPPWDHDELVVKMENASAYALGTLGAERVDWQDAEDLRLAYCAPTGERPSDATRKTEPDQVIELSEDTLEASSQLLDALAYEVPGQPELVLEGFAATLKQARREVDAELGADVDQAARDLRPLFVPASELLAAPPTITPWLVRGLLRDGGVAMIAAGPKAGKTWCALEMACAVATGTRAFGTDRFKAPRARAVGYFFAEDDVTSVVAHVRAFASGRGIRVEDLAQNLYLCPMGRHIDLTRDSDLALVLASAREIPSLGMLAMDPLRDVHSGAENESDDMSDVFGRLRFLARKLGATVLTPHHAKKLTREDVISGALMSGGAIRGSSAIFGALDSLIMIARDDKKGDESTILIDARSIIKGAKSAGAFALTLKIVDDERDLAKHAEWLYQSQTDAKAAAVEEDVGVGAVEDEAVALIEHLALIEARKEPPRDVRRLRKEMGVGSARMTAALACALGKGWISKGERQKYELTAAGRALTKSPTE